MNMGRRETAASLLLCFLLSLGMLLGPAHIVQAQERFGTITGQVTDTQGGCAARRHGDTDEHPVRTRTYSVVTDGCGQLYGCGSIRAATRSRSS